MYGHSSQENQHLLVSVLQFKNIMFYQTYFALKICNTITKVRKTFVEENKCRQGGMEIEVG